MEHKLRKTKNLNKKKNILRIVLLFRRHSEISAGSWVKEMLIANPIYKIGGGVRSGVRHTDFFFKVF